MFCIGKKQFMIFIAQVERPDTFCFWAVLMLPLLGPAMTNTLQRWRDKSFNLAMAFQQ